MIFHDDIRIEEQDDDNIWKQQRTKRESVKVKMYCID